MSKLYCQKCSQPTEYLEKKPLFCSNCGHPFTQVVTHSALSARKIENKRVEVAVEESDDDSENLTVPHIDKIDIEPIGKLRNSVTFRELIFDKTPKASVEKPKTKHKLKPPSKEEFWREFRDEIVGKKKSLEISDE